MVGHIFKGSNVPCGAGLMFKLIGISNVACSIFVCFQAVMTDLTTSTVLVGINSFATIASFLLQLGFNVSLAFERLQVIRYPMKYHTAEAKRGLEKMLCLIVLVLSLILGASCSALRFILNNILITSISLAASRIAGYIILCILYCILYSVMKAHNQAIANTSAEQCKTSTSNREAIIKRRKQLEHSKKFFIGITSSFFILNLPAMAIFFITDEYPSCNTVKGILCSVSIGLSLFNMMFDSAWYFYMHRRSTRV